MLPEKAYKGMAIRRKRSRLVLQDSATDLAQGRTSTHIQDLHQFLLWYSVLRSLVSLSRIALAPKIFYRFGLSLGQRIFPNFGGCMPATSAQ